MIKLEEINKSFGELILFENLNIEITEKKTKIKGENGTGKSVLLKMIVGYSTPDSGKIFYDNKEIGKDSDFLQDAGVSINAPQFMKTWTGLENLRYLANIKKVCTEKELMDLIKFFELENVIEKKYKTYSLGMQQKLRLIQTLMDKPKYLILDEPFEALDKKTKLLTKNYLDSYLAQSSDRILIYTSHDESDDDFADCIFEIEDRELHML